MTAWIGAEKSIVTKPTGYHHPGLKEKLLECARRLLQKKGPDGWTLREVARMARVSHTAPYRHFQDRNDLLVALAGLGFAELLTRGESAFALHPDDPEAQFLAYGGEYVGFAEENPDLFRLMFGEHACEIPEGHPVQEVGRRSYEILVEVLRRCGAAGITGPAPAEVQAVAAWAYVHGLSFLLIDGRFRAEPGMRSAAALWDTMRSFLMNGLLRR